MKMEKGKGKDIKIDIAEAKKRYLIQSSQYREKRLRGEQGKKKQRSAKVPKLVNYGYICAWTARKPLRK
jgi:hypothetical protein